jgi:hypothetical protein
MVLHSVCSCYLFDMCESPDVNDSGVPIDATCVVTFEGVCTAWGKGDASSVVVRAAHDARNTLLAILEHPGG